MRLRQHNGNILAVERGNRLRAVSTRFVTMSDPVWPQEIWCRSELYNIYLYLMSRKCDKSPRYSYDTIILAPSHFFPFYMYMYEIISFLSFITKLSDSQLPPLFDITCPCYSVRLSQLKKLLILRFFYLSWNSLTHPKKKINYFINFPFFFRFQKINVVRRMSMK